MQLTAERLSYIWMSSLGPVQAPCPETSATTGRVIRDSHMAHPLLGFPAEDGPCRTEPPSDQLFQHAGFLGSVRPHCEQVAAHLEHLDRCHPASHPLQGLWLGSSWCLGSCLYERILLRAGPSTNPDPVLGGCVHVWLQVLSQALQGI